MSRCEQWTIYIQRHVNMMKGRELQRCYVVIYREWTFWYQRKIQEINDK